MSLNVKKTKEIAIDFRTRHKDLSDPVVNKDCMVERVSDYKYLWSVMDDRLNWSEYIAWTLGLGLDCIK